MAVFKYCMGLYLEACGVEKGMETDLSDTLYSSKALVEGILMSIILECLTE
jgi:hypothetical protein